MRRILLCFLLVMLLLTVISITGCFRGLQKEYQIVEDPKGSPKSLLVREIEVDRFGDQELTDVHLTKEDPNGLKFTVDIGKQKSEGKLQIEGVIDALTKLAATLTRKGMTAEASQLTSIAEDLAAASP